MAKTNGQTRLRLRNPDWLRQRYQHEGAGDEAIARELGCSRGAVRYARDRYGIPSRRCGRPPRNPGEQAPEFSLPGLSAEAAAAASWLAVTETVEESDSLQLTRFADSEAGAEALEALANRALAAGFDLGATAALHPRGRPA
jgi:hypothetical protein